MSKDVTIIAKPSRTLPAIVYEEDHRSLLSNLRKSVELWFLTNRDLAVACSDDSYYHIQVTMAAILLDGLTIASQISNKEEVLKKLIGDFEWAQRSTQIRDNFSTLPATMMDTTESLFMSESEGSTARSSTDSLISIDDYLLAWILRNLKTNCLCSCLQVFVADKELLEYYYSDWSFLRNDSYATALFICISALELNQYSLLSQIEPSLYSAVNIRVVKHTRSSSHPNFSISPPKKLLTKEMEICHVRDVFGSTVSTATNSTQGKNQSIIYTFRKSKSLPIIHGTLVGYRSRSKSSKQTKHLSLQEGIEQQHSMKVTARYLEIPFSSVSSFNLTTWGSTYDTTIRKSTFYSSSVPAPPSTSVSERQIELIKCDDIKIWFDESWENKQQQTDVPPVFVCAPSVTESLSIPQAKQAKTTSPINSFFSNIFNTPSCTSWSSDTSAITQGREKDAFSSSLYNQHNQLHVTNNQPEQSGVFDSFLPKYGRKLKSRNSQNLFEDGNSSLDSKYLEFCGSRDHVAQSCSKTLKDRQSLTTFLQMSQHSRNNTELEKENAHFRISEAIISAIEHIKWAKVEPDNWRRRTNTTTATDWLKSSSNKHLQNESERLLVVNTCRTQLSHNGSNEHITYAELGESCLDLLSAEVVGLSLISKFDDKHLPKVSDLKWLVSEEDTPQSLLPMPSDSPTANPDENILPSITRGTKYWAPPRQQIIFTDHPSPNRKKLIQRQNNRCAGCGMRVSAGYINSFRYCTYLGKYHCTGCHRNQISATPAKILHMWDFKCYPVSVFAYRLLEQMWTYPLFYVPDLNPELYVKNKVLFSSRLKRVQLKFVKDFIRSCRFAATEQKYFDSISEYVSADPDTWSMSDFFDARSKCMSRMIEDLIAKCENHIFNCVLCSARGFVCEICQKDQIIYPWQPKTFRCDKCGVCVHQNCWKAQQTEHCYRCQRLKNRLQGDQDQIIDKTNRD